MQNNNSINKGAALPSQDRQETVTLSKKELDELINAAVNAAITRFAEEIKTSEWLNTKAASVILGKKPDQLRRMVKDGRLRINKEVRDERPKNAIKPVYAFNIFKCEQRLLTPPEKRG